ncbi:hypothetical protein C2S51_028007 [Perilla frutescens var. frutescens]|nr:hypothetical protein C2S51_028007 [Perilla frutescens var. frutescens]
MSLIPIFKNNPISHLHDPFTMDIFKDLHNHHEAMVAQHVPLHRNTVAPFSTGATVEWNETPEAHVLRAELPGLKKEEVKVKVEEGKFLKISGKKKLEKEEKHENWHHVERSKGKFSRVFTLPDNSRADRVKSQFENAILVVTVPKRDVKKSRVVRNVEVNG